MALTLSDGELLLRTFYGRCGHRRQSGLPCATPGCREGVGHLIYPYRFERIAVLFGDEKHYLWRKHEKV